MRQDDIAWKNQTERDQVGRGGGTKPKKLASQEHGKAIPIAAMMRVVVMSAVLARLWNNGIVAVRIIWMIKVWVSRDSTNQPVWNNAGLFHALKT